MQGINFQVKSRKQPSRILKSRFHFWDSFEIENFVTKVGDGGFVFSQFDKKTAESWN